MANQIDRNTNAAAPYTTVGEGRNELVVPMQSGGGAHDVRVLSRANTDALLVHMAKVDAAHMVFKEKNTAPNIPRSIKELLLRDWTTEQ